MNRKINVDRPEPDYAEIAAGKDFSSLVQQATAAKTAAFYTTKWFMGGVATITGITLLVIAQLQFGTPAEPKADDKDTVAAFASLKASTVSNTTAAEMDNLYAAELLNCTSDIGPCEDEVEIINEVEEEQATSNNLPNVATNNRKREELVKPILANPNRFRFDIEVDQKEFPEVAAYKGTYFEVLPSNNGFSSDYFDVLWDDVKVERSQNGKQHTVVLVRDNEEVRIAVQPVLSASDHQRALEEYQRKLTSFKQ